MAGLSAPELERRQKRRQWRLRRQSSFMGQACTSIHQTSKGLDKTYEDCEDWCDEGKIGHCRYCKCRGCKHCHGDLSLPDWVFGAPADQQCAAFGLCANQTVTYPLCLSVWKGETHEGAPLVWSRCRTDRYAHQQWRRVVVPMGSADSGPTAESFLLENGPVEGNHANDVHVQGGQSAAEQLCVAAPMPMSLL